MLRVTGDLRPSYLRLAVLDEPGPDAWASRPIDAVRPRSRPARCSPARRGSTATSTRPLTPMRIDPTRRVPGGQCVAARCRSTCAPSTSSGDWSYVPAVTGRHRQHRRWRRSACTSYDLAYSSVNPTAEQLRAAGPPPADIVETYAQVPSGVPAIIAQEARAITPAPATPYDQALLCRAFFRDPSQFTYDLDAGYGYGYEAMVKFLDQRRGFCQHFAATMAMMARELGIPSRVVVGFLQPERTDGDAWVLTSHDVHAWPELYFEGSAGCGSSRPRCRVLRFRRTPRAPTAPAPDRRRSGTAQEQTSDDQGRAGDHRQDDRGARPTAARVGGGGSALPSRWWLARILVAARPRDCRR